MFFKTTMTFAENIDTEIIAHADQDFIAHARQNFPMLLAEIERLRGLIGP